MNNDHSQPESHGNSLASLIESYLRNELSEDETAQFLELLEKSEESQKLFRDNIQTDFLLNRIFTSPPQMTSLNSVPLGIHPALWPSSEHAELFGPAETLDPSINTVITCPDPVGTPPARGFVFWESEADKQKRRKKYRRLIRRIVIGVIGTLSLFLFAFFCQSLFLGSRDIKPQQKKFEAIATIVETINPVWTPDSPVYKRGQKTAADRIALQSGLVKLKMNSGVMLILEGPCDFVLYGPDKTFCNKGKVSASVPPEAVGFEINSPYGKIIDLGTEFFLEITDRESHVEVMKGKIEVNSATAPSQYLTSGNAIRLNKTNLERMKSFSDKLYYSSMRFTKDLTEHVSKQLTKRQMIQHEWDLRPGLMARFQMDKTETELVNYAAQGENRKNKARIIGCTTDEGSLYGTRGIRFSDRSDRIEYSPKRSVRNLTMITSVRIDQRLQLGNVLLSSKQKQEIPGTILWQISSLGFMQLQITPNRNEDIRCFDSKPFLFPNRDGVWYTFAVVLDSDRRRISFFVDGNRLSSFPWKNPVPIQLDTVSLGNVQEKTTASNRFLNGVMDSFYLFSEALSREEIAKIDLNETPTP